MSSIKTLHSRLDVYYILHAATKTIPESLFMVEASLSNYVMW